MDTILIVDDEPDLREALRTILEQEHYRVVDCSDGHEARLKVFDDPPDLIISDISMPEMDGWALVKELRTLPLTRFTPFLFLTGHVESTIFREALRAGVDGVMSKPIHRTELISTVRGQLERYRSLKQESLKDSEGLRKTLALSLPHGLNTSLHIINGYTTLLASELSDNQTGLRDYSTKILDAAQRLHGTLQKLWLLLEVDEMVVGEKRADASKSEGSCSLEPLLRTVTYEVSGKYRREANFTTPVPDVHLRLSDRLAGNLFREVLENAFHFSPDKESVEIAVTMDDRTATIEVSDHGRGMTDGGVEGLTAFESFQRDRFAQKGHGLGLAIVLRILQLCQGSIRISSSPGMGSTVALLLPRVTG